MCYHFVLRMRFHSGLNIDSPSLLRGEERARAFIAALKRCMTVFLFQYTALAHHSIFPARQCMSGPWLAEKRMAPSALCPRGGSAVLGGNDGTLRSHEDYMRIARARAGTVFKRTAASRQAFRTEAKRFDLDTQSPPPPRAPQSPPPASPSACGASRLP